MPLDPVILVIYALALASITRLVTGTDSLTESANAWAVGCLDAIENAAVDFLDDRPGTAGWHVIKLTSGMVWFLGKMITCMWCASFWLALLMLWGSPWWDHPTALFIATALAFRQFVGMTSSMGR